MGMLGECAIFLTAARSRTVSAHSHIGLLWSCLCAMVVDK
jgi:hypothetical protein